MAPDQLQVMQLQRDAGNHAVTLALQRQVTVQRAPADEAGFKIISQTWEVSGRPIVVVATGRGDEVLFFYKRSGKGAKGVGAKVESGKWAPFEGLMAQDAEIIGREIEITGTKESHRLADRNYVSPETGRPQVANPEKAWFNKQKHYSKPQSPELRGYGNETNKQVGEWLDKQKVDPPSGTKDWQAVEVEMDGVKSRYQAQVRGPEGGGSGGAAGGATKAGSEAKAAGVEVKAAGVEAKAIGTEAKLIGAEVTGAIKTENVLTKGAQLAAKGAKIARMSELLIALGMPGPQDVLFMFIAAFASIAEAKAKLRASAFATGFAQGIAAVITWTDPEKAARMLAYKVADPEMGERVAGFEGTREKGTNDGLKAGWKFGSALNGDQRKGFRGMALDATGIRLKRHYNRDELIEIGGALRPTVVDLLNEAARQEQEKEDKAKAEAYSRGLAARRR